MMVECPVCKTENESESRVCVKCATPFDLGATIAVGTPTPDETIVVTPADLPQPPPPSDSGETVQTPSTAWTPSETSRASSSTPPQLVPGAVLAGRYQILKILGEGGMGAVYQARDREVDRTVAIKVIRPELSGHPEILRRFKQELILARQVTHRNVIRIFDLGVAEGRRFITMDYVDGRNLQSILTERKHLPVEEAVDIIRQVLMGLEAAHNEGVVHRDLKPQNIMVDASGRVYLMDFGIAKSMELAGMTRTGVLMGTPDYMSPEQAKGEKADARSDLFTVGVIFFELLTGQQPYRSETVMQTLVRRTKERAIPTRQLDSSIPQYINDVVAKCLEIDPDHRYQSAAQILRDLDPNSSKPGAPPAVFDPYLGMEAGTSFGPRYRIEGLLGEGGMGKVYKAYDRDLDRLVALKLVRPELARDPIAMERLKQELLLASKIPHKNIVRINDLGDVDGVKFISMAYVDGQDLETIIRRKGRLPLEEALAIARQLCRALESAHAENVVHRDLKPQNVLIDQQDNAFILDFGLARTIETGATLAGEMMGTPRYMSPEQAEGLAIDHRSDLYAIGLILYEMVTGDLPFESQTVMQAMYQRVTQPPKNPKLLNPDLPDRFVAVILKCLEKDPAQRYQNAAELLRELDTAFGPDETKVTLRLPTMRRMVFAAVAFLALLGGVLSIPGVRHRLLPGIGNHGPDLSHAKFVALMPFRVAGDAGDSGYLAEGITDSLSAKLLDVQNIRLSSPASASKIDQEKTPVDQIARQLGATYVVTGDLQAAADKLNLVVKLVDTKAANAAPVIKEFTGDRRDVLSLENSVYNYLIGQLGLQLSNDESSFARTRNSADTQAYDLYLRAQASVRAHRDVPSLEAALDQYKRAADKDPTFALAFAGIADTSLKLYKLTKDTQWVSQAQGAAQRAQSLNDRLPEVHFVLGSVYEELGQTTAATAELERGANMAPNSDDGWWRLARVYDDGNRQREAEIAYKKAIDVNPYFWSNYNHLGIFYQQHDRLDDALKAFDQVTKLEPKSPIGWINVAAVACTQGNWQLCITGSEKAAEIKPDPIPYRNMGLAYYMQGKYGEGAKALQKAVELTPKDQAVLGMLADCYRYVPDPEKATDYYEKAITAALRDLSVNPRDSTTMGVLATYYAKRGSEQHALDYLARAKVIAPDDSELLYDSAVVNVLFRRYQEATSDLKKAVQKGYSIAQIADEPDFKPLQADPAFKQLVGVKTAAK